MILKAEKEIKKEIVQREQIREIPRIIVLKDRINARHVSCTFATSNAVFDLILDNQQPYKIHISKFNLYLPQTGSSIDNLQLFDVYIPGLFDSINQYGKVTIYPTCFFNSTTGGNISGNMIADMGGLTWTPSQKINSVQQVKILPNLATGTSQLPANSLLLMNIDFYYENENANH